MLGLRAWRLLLRARAPTSKCIPVCFACSVLQALLRRLELRLSLRGAATDGAACLLRQLSPSAPPGRKLERYPVRVMLCAYMITEHPEVVFSNVVSAASCAGVVCLVGWCWFTGTRCEQQ